MSNYNIPDIEGAIRAYRERKIKQYPCKVNRASSLGYFVPELEGCLRRGVYERTRWQDKELHDADTQGIFDEGNYQEEIVLDTLAKSGITIYEQQRSYDWPQYMITGHIDGKLQVGTEDGNIPIGIPCEIKSMAPHLFDTIHEFEDFKRKPWHRAYMVQITLYMLMENEDEAIFILKNKSTGRIRPIPVKLDYEMGEWALKTAEAINKHVAEETLPDKIKDVDVCAKCPYGGLCQPDISFGTPLTIADDPALESKIKDYMLNKVESKRVEKLYKEQIQPKCKATAGEGELNMLIGPYRLTGKSDKRGTFRLKIEEV